MGLLRCCRLQQRLMPSWRQLLQQLLHVLQSHSCPKRRWQLSARSMILHSRQRLESSRLLLRCQQQQSQANKTISAKLQVLALLANAHTDYALTEWSLQTDIAAELLGAPSD